MSFELAASVVKKDKWRETKTRRRREKKKFRLCFRVTVSSLTLPDTYLSQMSLVAGRPGSLLVSSRAMSSSSSIDLPLTEPSQWPTRTLLPVIILS